MQNHEWQDKFESAQGDSNLSLKKAHRLREKLNAKTFDEIKYENQDPDHILHDFKPDVSAGVAFPVKSRRMEKRMVGSAFKHHPTVVSGCMEQPLDSMVSNPNTPASEVVLRTLLRRGLPSTQDVEMPALRTKTTRW